MIVKCKLGGELLEVAEGRDPHEALDANGCSHCADRGEGHGHHGENANACPRTHAGPCWNPPEIQDRPDGCTVCRPLLFFANATVGPVS